MPRFMNMLTVMETDDEFERDSSILEDYLWVQDHFEQHGVFQIEEYSESY